MSDAERFQRVSELFEQARALPPGRRAALLHDVCGDDADLHARVLRLLHVHESDDGAFESPALPESLLEQVESLADAESELPERIGPYRVKKRLGIGGMGVVYLAEQDSPRRDVALKVIRPGIVTPQLLKRFELEAAMLGRLQHPGIARIYQAGTFDGARGRSPFFAMEHVQGAPLTRYAREQGLSTRERIELLARVCQAVHHAHQRGVIHRDLKPGNILVDETGSPKVLDFGVARATDSDIQVTTVQTDVGQLIGTLPYMSPEQISGSSADVDVRSDVYALGVMLYELLTERLPYTLEGSSILSAARAISESEPAPLSTISRAFRGDLNTIVLHALEKNPQRRYQSASDLAADLRRLLADRPIVARPASTMYHIRKFASRNRALVAALAAAGVILVSSSVVATTLAVGQARARADATQRAEDLERVTRFQAKQLSSVDPSAMGEQLRDYLLSKVADSLAAGGVDAEEASVRLAELSRLLQRVNFTDAALASLNENIFARAIETAQAEFEAQPLVRAELLQTLGSTMRELGLVSESLPPQREALELRREHLGNEHPDTLLAIDKIGMTLKELGELTEAGAYYEEALRGRKHVLGEEHSSTLITMINLGLLRLSQGDAPAAERVFRDVHETASRVLGPDDPMVLRAENNLGNALERQGRYDEAIAVHRRALEGRERLFGEDDLDTITGMNNLGVALLNHDMLDEAAPFLSKALAARRRTLGNAHGDTVGSMSNLAVLLRRQGRLDEAERLYLEALGQARSIFGDLHPVTLTLTNNMGALRREQGRLEEGVEYYRLAATGRREALGEGHPATLSSLRGLSACLMYQGRMDEAEEVLTSAFDASQKPGPNHARSACQTLDQIVELHLAWEDQEPAHRADAIVALEQALSINRTAHGEHDATTLSVATSLAMLHGRAGRTAECERMLREVVDVQRESMGEDHADTISTRMKLALAMFNRGDYQSASNELADLGTRLKQIDPGGETWAAARFVHGCCLLLVSNSEEAEATLLRAHDQLAEDFGRIHPDAMAAAAVLAEFYSQRGDTRRSEMWRSRNQTDLSQSN